MNAYNTLKKYQDMQDISTIDKIAWAVDSVKIMEQSLEYMTGPKAAEGAETQKTKSTKISLGQRFRNALNAFRKSE